MISIKLCDGLYILSNKMADSVFQSIPEYSRDVWLKCFPQALYLKMPRFKTNVKESFTEAPRFKKHAFLMARHPDKASYQSMGGIFIAQL